MNSVWQSIVQWIARKVGLELAQKTEQDTDFYNINNISLDAMVAETVANITLAGSSMSVDGTSERASMIQEYADLLYNKYLKTACTFALGTGSSLVKPNTDGERFGFDIIGEDSYYIAGYIGDYIYDVIIKSGAYKTETSEYILAEEQSIKTDSKGMKYLSIKYLTFCDGKPVPITDTRWKDYTDKMIPNVDKLLFGRIKCPTINRADVNSPCGVPITFGTDEQKGYVKDSYRRYNQEFKDKEPYIFGSKTIFKKDKRTGEAVIPDGKERVFMASGRSVDDNGISIYAPEYQETALDSGVERNLRMFEQSMSLGEGILTKPTATYENMDRVRASKQATYSFILTFRRSIDDALQNVLYAIDILANANEVTPSGEYDAKINWSDEYMSSLTEKFNQAIQANDMGWIDDAEGRALYTGEDIDEAREKVEEIKREKDSDMDKNMMRGDE